YIIPPAIKALGKDAVDEFENQMKIIQGFYNGWSKKLGSGEKGNEDARFVLPNAAETKFLVTMNARELMHFFNLRCCNRAQWEIRELSYKMLSLVYSAAPDIFINAGPSCASGACSEGKMSCGKAEEVRQKAIRMKAQEVL
ncbi:MAG: FAD-dependent thymidylate synthase, partial [Firmicutes bacterium]|nr:FAD-dependent thymidylate synthase [Bacillota bacterium]